MQRRHFLKTAALGAGASFLSSSSTAHNIQKSDVKVTKVSFYHPPNYTPRMLAQAQGIVVVECNNGLIGIGEGGTRDLIENLAPWLIGRDPMQTEHIWQLMLRGLFYPGGRELQHAIGALDIALWDIKGKLLGQPIYNLLGGKLRDYIPLYSTGFPSGGSNDFTEIARNCVQSGFKAYRTGGIKRGQRVWDQDDQVRFVHEHCQQIKAGVEGIGEWAIDFHTRFEKPYAIRLANLIEDLEPIFVEDLIRSENQELYKTIRNQVKVPIAVGEHFGMRWDFNALVENDLIDHCRATLPNTAGITEYKKIMSMCETHYVGLIPHFTGPIATAALTHCVSTFTGFVMMEWTGGEAKIFFVFEQ